MANYDTKSSKGMLKQQLSQSYYSKLVYGFRSINHVGNSQRVFLIGNPI